MEQRGQVNCYEPWGWHGGIGSEVYVINLAAGVTPFMHLFDGREYSSLCYRLRRPVRVTVAQGHYRPRPEEFATLAPDVQEHVLNGGLLSAPLAVATERQLSTDPVEADWDFERFQGWCQKVYGRRLRSHP